MKTRLFIPILGFLCLSFSTIYSQDFSPNVTEETTTTIDCSCVGANTLIKNPSFETVTADWTVYNGALTSETYATQCGSKSGHFNHGDAAGRGGFYQDVVVTPGAGISLKFFGGVHETGPTARVRVTFYDETTPLTTGIVTADVNAILPNMSLYTLTSTAPATTTKMRIEGSTNGGTENQDWLKVDGFCLTITPVCNASITGLRFYDINSSSTVSIANNGTYDIASLPSSFGTEALVSGNVESVTFSVTGSGTGGNTENVTPYTYPGTGSSWSLGIGTFTVVVNAYTADNAVGQSCDTETFTFTITNNSCNCPNNLLVNGSFESYNATTFLPNSWVEENGEFNSDDYAKQCGNKSGVFKQNGSTNIGKFYQQVPNIVPGTNVSLTFYAGVHDLEPANAFVRIIFYNGNSPISTGVAEVEIDYSPLPGMQKYTLTGIAPTGTTSLRIEGSTDGESGSDNDGKDGDWLKVDAFCLTTVCVPVNAGTDGIYEVCDNALIQINLNNYITGEQAGGVWTLNGQTVSNMLNPSAGASMKDYIYTVTGTAPCGNDMSKVTVKVVPKADAGTDGTYEVCDNALVQINLFDYITGEQSGGVWTLNGQTVSNMLTPSAGASMNDYIYTVTGTAPCGNDMSKVTVKVVPKADAGTDGTYEVCDNALVQINLNDFITGEQTGGKWYLNNIEVSNTFKPTTGASTNEYVYKIVGNTPCGDDESKVVVTVFPAPQGTVNAGPDGELCARQAGQELEVSTYQLAGSISGSATSATWDDGGAGGTFSPNANSLNAIYSPPTGFTIITLTLTTNDPSGPCDPEKDQMSIKKKSCFGILDPCSCYAVTYGPTEVMEVKDFIEIAGTPGQTWKIVVNGGAPNLDNPPANYGTMQLLDPNKEFTTNIDVPIGTVVPPVSGSPGVYRFDFAHDSGKGYNVTVEDEAGNRLSVKNYCVITTFTPDINISGTLCDNAGPKNLNSIIQDPNPPVVGNVTYTYTVNNGPETPISTTFDPMGLAGSTIKIFAKYTPEAGNMVDCVILRDATGNISVTTCALPVNLINFEGKVINDQVMLNWKIADEKNFSHFEVEHTTSGTEFGSIGKVFTNGKNYFNYADNNPEKGDNYYRLKMVDLDGSFNYSKIVNINFEKNINFVNVVNPSVDDSFTINTNLKNPSFSLLTSNGSKIETTTISNGSRFIVKPANAPAGLYFLNIVSEGKVVTKKVIVR